jgi:hypothetical protein
LRPSRLKKHPNYRMQRSNRALLLVSNITASNRCLGA